jgi:DNA polymerase-3 subunit delta'
VAVARVRAARGAGPIGLGKVNLALVLADRLLTRRPAETPPVLRPEEALTALAGRHAPADHHPDLHWLHPEEDKHTISVEQIRGVIDALALTAHGGGAKVVVIEPADAMTPAATNALLKTLEEPSADTYLFLLSHRPGGLAPTIRSRCQRLNLVRPPQTELVAWLGPKAPNDAWRVAGGSPLAAAALAFGDMPLDISRLYLNITAISEDRLDPLAEADAWAKADPGFALTWLVRELHEEIGRRLGAGVSTPVTDQLATKLHNAWSNLTLRALFEQYERAEKLLNQLGSGINQELALQALLVGFQKSRGQS